MTVSTNLLPIPDTTGSLLPVTGGELVSYLGCLDCADPDLAELVSFLVDGDHHLVHNTCLAASHEDTGISLGESARCCFQLSQTSITLNTTVD